MNNILVVCIGNICRSPMAEALFRQKLPHVHVRSAGLGALIGSPADSMAVNLMEEMGVDMSGHIAQQITTSLVSQAELVLVMDAEQKRYVENKYLGSRGKVFRLGEAAQVDIPDPYRKGVDMFRLSQRLIKDGVDAWANHIASMG